MQSRKPGSRESSTTVKKHRAVFHHWDDFGIVFIYKVFSRWDYCLLRCQIVVRCLKLTHNYFDVLCELFLEWCLWVKLVVTARPDTTPALFRGPTHMHVWICVHMPLSSFKNIWHWCISLHPQDPALLGGWPQNLSHTHVTACSNPLSLSDLSEEVPHIEWENYDNVYVWQCWPSSLITAPL